MPDNQKVYEVKEVAKRYATEKFLFPAEKEIFSLHNHCIQNCNVLDIGVGGGRTTSFLAPLCKSITAVDYSRLMVEICKKRFSEFNNIELICSDAANMSDLKKNSFDFVLFSFNGIDCVDENHRAKILFEMKRVLNPEGILCFSFHNVRNLNKLYSFQFPKNPFKYWGEWNRVRRLKKINGPKTNFESKKSFALFDGADDFNTQVMYLLPEYQSELLKNAGFKNIVFYDALSGKELKPDGFKSSETPWIYLTCQKNA